MALDCDRIDPENREIVTFFAKISREKNIFVERFLSSIVSEYEAHPVSTD